jgi:hypothetical protein
MTTDRIGISEAFQRLLWELANLYANGPYYRSDLPFSGRLPRSQVPPDAIGVNATYYRLIESFDRGESVFDEAAIRQTEGMRGADRKYEESICGHQ